MSNGAPERKKASAGTIDSLHPRNPKNSHPLPNTQEPKNCPKLTNTFSKASTS